MGLSKAEQATLNDSEDMKLGVDGMRAVFTSGGKTQPKHQRALDALARFCKVGATDHGTEQAEINRIVGRLEVFNYIMFCLKYPKRERRKLAEQITELEDIRDHGRRPSSDD